MTSSQHYTRISAALQISTPQVTATAELLAGGATVPFISRYRKETTGLLDEIQVAAIRDLVAKFAELDRRRQAILESLSERNLLSEKLKDSLEKADNVISLEDIYLPFKQKRKTRALMAKERGLEPLARAIFTGVESNVDISSFITPDMEISSQEDAYTGARDIIAEWMSEDLTTRSHLRKLFREKAILSSTVVKKNRESGAKFRDYFEWQEEARKAPGHRILAMFRGESEKILRVSLKPSEELALALLRSRYSKQGKLSQQMTLAMEESYKRLLGPSLEKELHRELKEKADQEAIQVFGGNLRELLLAPALGQKRVMALDPGFRTGAKLVCLDEQGKLLHFSAIYPTHGGKKEQEAGEIIRTQCQKQGIQAIAIGNGTAGRETEQFVHSLHLKDDILITLVNESGASIYSASDVARREFPDHDITVRGAVSIGRRLQDPLAELVKLDPKSIGVGQYQHDVNQTELKNGLEDVVVSCVNSVGVEVNSASRELLTYVSGLGPVLADNIIAYRNEHGPFLDRKDLKHVPRLGAKAYEQCAGFLRIHGAKNPLDDSAVHPEQYKTVAKIASDLSCNIADLMSSKKRRDSINLKRYISDTLGLATLHDILEELAKPGRDPREDFVSFAFAKNVNTIDDLIAEMKLPGIVTNVTRFGAFVDIGVHQDGLIHISQLADRFVRDPAEVVKAGQQLTVRVLEVDKERRRIALSLREL
ncbi:transcriptional accessory protein [Desulfocapsa sulfexigens DSM 10523]|uniref:Transcriptional accessory protein n=1 Tax=Desulfocapsa sulfexigens (strain DSM 10523 / SB164P1) TaxID=1167006 RepID=M1PGD3_DESSD|nr:Tex family protein [Desulfocapsa sulfexigens]AGF78715.1 transcriptional accessory protein [Desulfocapsa sulfexigens DSM 10523]